MKVCVSIFFFLLLILLVVFVMSSWTHAYQRAIDLNREEVDGQAVYNTSSLQGGLSFRYPQRETKARRIKSDILTQTMLSSISIYRTRMSGDKKFRNYQLNSDIGGVKNRYFRVETKNEQQTKTVSQGVRIDVKSKKQNVTRQNVECEVASLSCRNCCGNSKNCSHKTKFCRCDMQCTFYKDCCVDYETFCGKKQNISFRAAPPQGLSCTEPRYVDMTSGYGVWLINKCPNGRQDDENTRTCEKTDGMEFNITNLQHFVPVVGSDNLIYRNKFCAKCNGIERFEYFKFGLNMKCHVVPPATVASLTELSEFASQHCEQKETSIFTYGNQPIRECNEYFRSLCPSIREMNERCNQSCLYCDDDSCISRQHWCNLNVSIWDDNVLEKFVSELIHVSPYSVTLRLSRGRSFSTVQKLKKCPGEEQFYDPYLETCRTGQSIPPAKKSLDKFYVVVWLDVLNWHKWNDFGFVYDGLSSRNQTIASLARLFNFKLSQASELKFDMTANRKAMIVFFKLKLSSEQTLFLAKIRHTEMNGSLSLFPESSRNLTHGLPLRRLLYFTKKFNITISNQTFSVFKTTSRQLACIRKQTYPQGTYASVSYGEYYYINSSGKTFAKSQVFFEENMNKSISVCEQIVFSSCVGRRVNLTSEEFVKFDNLSIFYNRTKRIYDFGEYDIEDGQIVMCIPAEPSTQFLINSNNSIAIQTYLTLTCLVLSLFCLFLVILTYIIFPEHRSLPGKNILSLSVSLFLAQLLWLISNRRYASTVCHVMAVIQHYAFLVSFLAMAIIAWNTHSVFASKDVRKNACKKRANKKFHKYSAIVWVLPAMFVAACVLVDQQDVYAVYVNEQWCWFGNMQAQIYLFVLPVGLLLLFNVVLFTLTVFHIQRVRSSIGFVRRSCQKQRAMFWIYLRISALMGFSWLFGFIDVFLESTTLVFSYLFIIFASLQGVYIALAFVMKKEVWEKYKKLVKGDHKAFRPDYNSTLLENLSSSKETRV